MAISRESKQEVSWYDVWMWCADLEKHWHCFLQFQESRNRHPNHHGVWDVRLVARWLGVGGAVVREEGISAIFPGNGARTVAGLYMGLIIQLDTKLTELEREKRSGAHKQDRLL